MAGEPNKELSCATCKLVFDTMNDVRLHDWLEHHGTPSIECESCIFGFTTKEEIIDHVRIHYLYCCDFCSLNTDTWSEYNNHVCEQHNILTWKTETEEQENSTCGDGFNNIYDLGVHVKENSQMVEESEVDTMIDMDGKQVSKDHFILPCMMSEPTEVIRQTKEGLSHSVSESTISKTALEGEFIEPPEGKNVCPYCRKGFHDAHALKEHMRVHTGEKPHLCPVCNKAFARLKGMKRHVVRIHDKDKKKPFECDACSKDFLTKEELKRHLLTHTGEKPHLCPICKKGFGRDEVMRDHMRVHTGEKPFVCPVCDKAFGRASNLNVHVQIHTGEKPHLCPVCEKGFTQAASMKEHMKIHTGEKPHLCPVCKRGFSQARTLKRHMSVHTGEKPHLCPVCKKGFSQTGSIKKHMRVHDKETALQCPVCKKSFISAEYVKKHLLNAHPEEEQKTVNINDFIFPPEQVHEELVQEQSGV